MDEQQMGARFLVAANAACRVLYGVQPVGVAQEEVARQVAAEILADVDEWDRLNPPVARGGDLELAKPVVRDAFAEVRFDVSGRDLRELLYVAMARIEQLIGGPIPELSVPRLENVRPPTVEDSGAVTEPWWRATAVAAVRRPVEVLSDPDRAVSAKVPPPDPVREPHGDRR